MLRDATVSTGAARTRDATCSPPSTSCSALEVTLYTDALITHGFVRTRQHRVTDILNLAEDPFLILEDVTVEEFGQHGEPIMADFAQINLDAVLFAVATTPVEPVAGAADPEVPRRRRSSRSRRSGSPGRCTCCPSEGNLRAALSELQGRFLPITDATYWSDHVGEPRQHGGARRREPPASADPRAAQARGPVGRHRLARPGRGSSPGRGIGSAHGSGRASRPRRRELDPWRGIDRPADG